jgi:hypothetical protein
VLETIAIIAIALLVAREFLALESGERSRRAARLAGWSAVPFLLVFAMLFSARVMSYLSGS